MLQTTGCILFIMWRFAPSLRIAPPVLFITIAVGLFAADSPVHAQHGKLQFAQLGRCRLENGAVIENCRIGYRTFGALDKTRDNAVLMPTWLYGRTVNLVDLFGDPRKAGPSAKADILVDTGKYFGIAIDALGNGVSSSPSNSTVQHGVGFPAFSTRDMVAAEYRVVTEKLGLKHLHAVIGLSMGGEQTFVWSVMYPTFFDDAVPILGTPRLTPYDLEVKQIMLGTILNDPAYDGGHYTAEPALKLANLFGTLVVTTPEFRNQATTREDFSAFLGRAEAPLPIDANDRIWQLRAIIKQDVVGNRTIAEAAKSTRAHFLVIVAAHDHLVNPRPALEWAAALHAPTYISQGDCAHLIMSCDAKAVSSRVREFLDGGNIE